MRTTHSMRDAPMPASGFGGRARLRRMRRRDRRHAAARPASTGERRRSRRRRRRRGDPSASSGPVPAHAAGSTTSILARRPGHGPGSARHVDADARSARGPAAPRPPTDRRGLGGLRPPSAAGPSASSSRSRNAAPLTASTTSTRPVARGRTRPRSGCSRRPTRPRARAGARTRRSSGAGRYTRSPTSSLGVGARRDLEGLARSARTARMRSTRNSRSASARWQYAGEVPRAERVEDAAGSTTRVVISSRANE